jgi:hypothetical protein
MTLRWIARRLNMGLAGSLAGLPRDVEGNWPFYDSGAD